MEVGCSMFWDGICKEGSGEYDVCSALLED